MQVKKYDLITTFLPDTIDNNQTMKLNKSEVNNIKKFVPKMRFVERLMPVKIRLHAWLYGTIK